MPRPLASKTGDFAVIGITGSYLSSIGTVVDGLTLIANQIERMFAETHGIAMETKVRLLSTSGRSITLAGGRSLAAEGDLTWEGPLQVIYLPAFEVNDETSLVQIIGREARLLEWLRRQHAMTTVIGGSAAAIFLLAEAGLLKKSSAAAPSTLLATFRRRYPEVHLDKRASVVAHQLVFTASGMADEWAIVARLVESCLSPHTSRSLATEVGLLRTKQEHGLAADPLVAAAQFWLGERFAARFRISDLAKDLAVSQTTLLRRFERSIAMTPRHYAQVLRIEAAKKMLVTTKRSIQLISTMVGYGDSRSFRHAFRERVGLSPTAYRKKAGRQ